MMQTIGMRIAQCRKRQNLTQEQLAEKMHISPQAVSKWETEISCPDIALLPELSQLLGVSIDYLVAGKEELKMRQLPQQQRKPFEELLLRVVVDSGGGDKVRLNLPMVFVKMALDMGLNMPQVTGKIPLEQIDFAQIIQLAEQGLIGELVEVQSADGDNIRIFIE